MRQKRVVKCRNLSEAPYNSLKINGSSFKNKNKNKNKKEE